jgi:TP901 family phage tail tape measure protein
MPTMSNEAKLEIEQNTKAMLGMVEATDKVVSVMAKLSRQQGTLKTTGKESLDALRAMQAGVSDFGSGLRGLHDAMQSMQTGLMAAMQELAATISTGFAGLAPKALQAGEDTTKNLAAGIGRGKGLVAQEVKKLQLEYEAAIRSGGSFTAEGLGFLKTRGVSLVPDDRAALVNTALAIKGRKEAADREAEIDKAYAQYTKQRSAVSMEALRAQEIAQEARIKSAQAADDAELLRVKRAGATYLAELKALDAQVASVMKKQTQPGNASSAYASAQVFAKQTANTPVYSRASLFGDGTLQALPVEHANLAKAVTGSTKALADNAAGMKIWTGHANDAHSAARGLASGFGAMWLTWGNIIPLLAGAAVSHTIAGVVKQGAEVNHIMETMRVLTDQSTESSVRLNAQMLEMSRNSTRGPKEVAEGMKQLALAGLNANEVGVAMSAVGNLSISGDTSMKTSADTLSQLGAAFKISAYGYTQIADVLAKTSAVSRASVESISEGMKAASVINSQYRVSLQDTAMGIAILNNLGISGTSAGTALRNFYVDLSGRSAAARAEMKRLRIEVTDGKGAMLDMLTIASNLDAGLRKMSQGDEAKSLQKMLGERGAKLTMPLLEYVRSAPEDTTKGYKNKGEELRADLERNAAFSAITSAQLAITAENQMKGVASSFKAAMVDAFSSAEPYVLSVSQKLREMFNSPEFKNGLQTLIAGVGALTQFLVDHGKTIFYVVGAYTALKTAQLAINVGGAVASGVASIANIRASASAHVEAYRAEQARVTSMQSLANASQGVAVASNTVASGAVAAAEGFSKWGGYAATLFTWLGRLNVVLGVAMVAWTLYDALKSGGAADQAKADAPLNKIKAENEQLSKQADALERINDAKAKGTTVERLTQERALAERRLMQGEYEVTAREFRAQLKLLQSTPLRIGAQGETLGGQARVLEEGRLTRGIKSADASASAIAALIAVGEKDTARLKAAQDAINTTNSSESAAAKKLREAMDRGDAGGPLEGSYTNLSMHESERLSKLSQEQDRELSTLKDANSKRMASLVDLHSNHLISDAAFYVQRSALEDNAYDSEKKKIASRQVTEFEAATKAQRASLKVLGEANVDVMSEAQVSASVEKFVKMTSAAFNARFKDPATRSAANAARTDANAFSNYKTGSMSKFTEADEKLEAAYTLSQEKANNALAGSYRKIEMSIQDLDKQMVGHHAQIMGQQADSLVSHPFEQSWEKADREQRKASLKKYADDIARIQAEILKKESESNNNLNIAWQSEDMQQLDKALKEAGVSRTEVAKLREQLAAQSSTSARFAKQEGAAARETAFKNEINVFQKDLASGVAGAMSTAIFKGGAEGGAQLRTFLEDMFIKKPLKILLETGIEKFLSGVGADAIGGLFNMAKGGLGLLGGTLADSGTTAAMQGGFGDAAATEMATAASESAAASATGMSAATLMETAASTMLLAANSMMVGGGGGSSVGLIASLAGLASSSGAGAVGTGAVDYGIATAASGAGGLGLKFGRPMASGGQASPFSMHQVNENGTELLSMGGRDYLMTGSQGGTVTSTRDMSPAGATIQHNMTIHIDSRTDQAQVHALVSGAVQQGNAQLVDQLHQAGVLNR